MYHCIMKEQILEISEKLKNNEISEHEAQQKLLFLFGSNDYDIITPDNEIISVDYNDKLEQDVNDFMTNKTQQELIDLFKTN